jgi:hypothetical protein
VHDSSGEKTHNRQRSGQAFNGVSESHHLTCWDSGKVGFVGGIDHFRLTTAEEEEIHRCHH